MQLTRNRVGMSRKAIAAGIATALLIGGIGSISAEAATKRSLLQSQQKRSLLKLKLKKLKLHQPLQKS